MVEANLLLVFSVHFCFVIFHCMSGTARCHLLTHSSMVTHPAVPGEVWALVEPVRSAPDTQTAPATAAQMLPTFQLVRFAPVAQEEASAAQDAHMVEQGSIAAPSETTAAQDTAQAGHQDRQAAPDLPTLSGLRALSAVSSLLR